MKEVKAFIRPIKASDVHQALKLNGYCCMSFSECEGTGLYTDPTENFPTLRFPFLHCPMVKIEIVCPDKEVESVVEIIQKSGTTGKRGDGIIYIMEVDEVYKVRNKSKGIDAL
jgi:nitrogen regulatory protein PII